MERCPHFRGKMCREVSSFQREDVWRGVLISEGRCVERCPHFRGKMCREVSSFQRDHV